MKTLKTLLLSLFFVFGLFSCGGGAGTEDTPLSSPRLTPIPTPTDNSPVQLVIDFSEGADGWSADFADYPIKDEILFDFISGVESIPSKLQNISGYRLSGMNRSDDLFMFIKKGFSGFIPGATYQLIFDITFATNAQSNCVGPGSPGTAVTIKAGASSIEPLKILNDQNMYRMNIDIGNQKNGGLNAIAIGNFANSQECDPTNAFFELKTLTNVNDKLFIITADPNGVLWFLFATDSGFESLTNIYFVKGSIVATNI